MPKASLRLLSPPEIDQLVDGYRQGDTAVELAARFGISRQAVYGHLARADAPRRPYRKLQRHLLDIAITMYEAGGSLRDVAEAVNVSRSALKAAFQTAGVSIRSRGGPHRNTLRRPN
jgi:predicted DNA-binding protein YlxM (UPF0122 family)